MSLKLWQLASLLLPTIVRGATNVAEISITVANSSTRWEACEKPMCRNGAFQFMDVVVNNTGNTIGSPLSAGLDTVQKAVIKRLMPGDSAIVEVGVQNQPGTPLGSIQPAKAVARWAKGHETSLAFNAICGIPSYDESAASINSHQAPNWFRRAKFGIFIHWGVYSVPAYGNKGENETYSEWYWSHQMIESDPSRTWQYHLETYGPDVVYDDFIANFTADKFNPKDWVDLIADAGAKYFVPTTKHHDGFALFSMPSTVSERNSVKQTPHRDLLKELFEAAEAYQPQLIRGTYFSLPEWFNPAYTKYGDGKKYGAGSPRNPYTNKSVPYVGYVEVDDFLTDIQAPQIEILTSQYNTSIMWCDSARQSHNDQLFAKWLNTAQEQKKQVTFNSRCGNTTTGQIVGDYLTPEYKPVNNFSAQHWEACRGLDPYSFAYNKLTPDDEYMNASTIVQVIVDITSKNGNLLLDMGPRADGTIPDVMSQHLREAGKWLKAHGESIYDTKYWPKAQGSGDIRYTTRDDAFFIHSLTSPAGSLVIPDKVPYHPGDKVVVLGGGLDGTIVPARLDCRGHLVLDITEEVASADDWVWTFKIAY